MSRKLSGSAVLALERTGKLKANIADPQITVTKDP